MWTQWQNRLFNAGMPCLLFHIFKPVDYWAVGGGVCVPTVIGWCLSMGAFRKDPSTIHWDIISCETGTLGLFISAPCKFLSAARTYLLVTLWSNVHMVSVCRLMVHLCHTEIQIVWNSLWKRYSTILSEQHSAPFIKLASNRKKKCPSCGGYI